MFALSQSSGNVPVINDWLNMAVSIGANSVAVSLRIWAGRSSGPNALFTLSCYNKFSTPLVGIVRLSIMGYSGSFHRRIIFFV